MSVDKDEDRKRAQNALAKIMSIEKRLPDDFDSEKELREARQILSFLCKDREENFKNMAYNNKGKLMSTKHNMCG